MGATQMPIHTADHTGYAIYTILMAAVTGGLLLWWVASPARRRDPALPLLLAGGALSVVFEPLYDNLVLFWYPKHQNLGAFTAFGRTVPICVVIGYAWFCGGLPYFVARYFQRGSTSRGLATIIGLVTLVDFVAIGLTSWLGIAGFYGRQPFEVADYPLWWAAVDVVNAVLGGALVYHLMVRRRRIYLLAVPPLVVGSAAGVVAGPAAIALNSGWSMLATSLAGIVSIAVAAVIVMLCTETLPRRTHAEQPAPGWLGDASPATGVR